MRLKWKKGKNNLDFVTKDVNVSKLSERVDWSKRNKEITQRKRSIINHMQDELGDVKIDAERDEDRVEKQDTEWLWKLLRAYDAKKSFMKK